MMYSIYVDGKFAGVKFNNIDSACDFGYSKRSEAKEKVEVINPEGKVVVSWKV